jgi:hypothetical protein
MVVFVAAMGTAQGVGIRATTSMLALEGAMVTTRVNLAGRLAEVMARRLGTARVTIFREDTTTVMLADSCMGLISNDGM